MGRKKLEQVVKRVISEHPRVLVGLAHYDNGVKVEGCDCCYCKPKKSEVRR